MAKQTLYTVSSTDDFIQRMYEKGYEAIQLNEGGVGIGDWVLIAPDEKHYNFVIKEVFLNAWSSAQTIRRCRRISKALQKQIEEVQQ